MSINATHDDLVELGAGWLKRQGFPVIASEISAAGCREQADLVAFRSTCSVVIEVKVSRADFKADAKKPERHVDGAGLGVYRFYLCPAGLILQEDLPPRWGLLHAQNGTISDIVRPRGNIWPAHGSDLAGWAEFQHQPNLDAERAALFSIARRLARGEAIMARSESKALPKSSLIPS